MYINIYAYAEREGERPKGRERDAHRRQKFRQ